MRSPHSENKWICVYKKSFCIKSVFPGNSLMYWSPTENELQTTGVIWYLLPIYKPYIEQILPPKKI